MPTAITTNRTVPWLGIGVSGVWNSSAEALEAAKLDFDVRQEDLYWQHVEPDGIVYDEKVPMYANVRNTDDKLLGCVTPQYKIIQNKDAFALIDPFLGNGKITHAGMTEDGLAFMVAEVEVERIIGSEPYNINLMVTNSFNTKYPCQIIMTPIRIYCQNMYRKLINDKIFLAKHTATANDRLIRIAQSGIVEKRVDTFANVIESYQGKKMTLEQIQTLVAMMFPYPKEGTPREVTFKVKVDQQREQFMDIYYDAQDNIKHHGTAFGFINSYYDWLSHRPQVRNSNIRWEDRRLSGIVSGLDIDNNLIKSV